VFEFLVRSLSDGLRGFKCLEQICQGSGRTREREKEEMRERRKEMKNTTYLYPWKTS
jgi:hypothetical protein